ncbi:MAG: glycosyltransferase [Clostridia bacterium]|nr:glycosyltransferase [Clostridia bacterium]
MIIGQFCDTFPPQVDGVGRVTLSYCQTLTAMGHETYYIAPESKDATEVQGFPVILSASVRMPGELFRVGLPGLDMRYRKQIREVPFDIVHAQSPFLAGQEALRIARKRDIPLVSTFHSKYYDDALAKTHSEALAKMVVKWIVNLYDKCDAVWTVNNATADVLRTYGYRGNVLIMENGTNREPLDPKALERVKARMPQQKGAPLLLFVGQHNWKKNLHGVLGACALLKQRGQRFRLVTAGDGPNFDEIQEEAETLGIAQDCTFLGFMTDRAELMALYHLADLLVFPSLYDNAPMVLREAAVMSTPGLLVAGSCSAEGIHDGYNGFISPSEQAMDIADTIQRALPLIAEVGENACRTIPVSWESIMQKVLVEYQRLLDGHVSRS